MTEQVVNSKCIPNETNVPEELRNQNQWVCWRWEKKDDGTLTKPPVNEKGYTVSVTDPRNWISFRRALSAAGRNSCIHGIGFVFSPGDPFSGVDLDDCRDPETGKLTPEAEEIIKKLSSYCEVSPSRTGVKIWVRGFLPADAPPGGRKNTEAGVEMYAQGRYFTVTGEIIDGSPRTIEHREKELQEVYFQHFPPASNQTGHSQKREERDDLFQWDGTIDHLPLTEEKKNLILNSTEKGSRSEAMMSVLNGLVFANLTDHQVFDVFREYPIGEKWREEHKSNVKWLQDQIDKARSFVSEKAKAAGSWNDHAAPSGGGNGHGRKPVPEWPDEPTPIDEPPDIPYPVESLPEIMLDAVREYQAYGQQPFSLVAGSALAALSSSAQHLANVARDSQLIGPPSLFLSLIAESGERKTACDLLFKRPVQEFERSLQEHHESEQNAFDARKKAWEAETRGIEHAIEKAGKAGNSTEELNQKLLAHMQKKPLTIRRATVLHQGFTPQALADRLQTGHYSQALWTDEGSVVLGGHGFSEENLFATLGILNKAWDGNGRWTSTLKTVPDVTVDGTRLSAWIQIQPTLLRNFASEAAMGTGAMARFLFTWPKSSIGMRPYRTADSLPAVERYLTRLGELLRKERKGAEDLPVLTMSPDAKSLWIDFYNGIEKELGDKGSFCEVKGSGAKAAENAARIAALFHLLENEPAGQIQAHTLAKAAQISLFHLKQFKAIFIDKPASDSDDAETLLKWLAHQQQDLVNLGLILRKGPNRSRSKRRRDDLIAMLAETGSIRIVEIGKAKFVEVHPKLRKKRFFNS